MIFLKNVFFFTFSFFAKNRNVKKVLFFFTFFVFSFFGPKSLFFVFWPFFSLFSPFLWYQLKGLSEYTSKKSVIFSHFFWKIFFFGKKNMLFFWCAYVYKKRCAQKRCPKSSYKALCSFLTFFFTFKKSVFWDKIENFKRALRVKNDFFKKGVFDAFLVKKEPFFDR